LPFSVMFRLLLEHLIDIFILKYLVRILYSS
jgi:hypothetical protein